MTGENEPVEHLTDSDPSQPPTAVVTGSSSGIGLAAAEELARRGWRVALVGRNSDRLRAAQDRVRAAAPGGPPVLGHRCDFEILDDVRSLADALRDAYPRIDVLANNAGAMTPKRSTVDGFPAAIQANYLAHFLLSYELRERLRGGRIVNTASAVHSGGQFDPGAPWRASSFALRNYGTAKQANILFTVEAARRWPDVVSAAFHPGVVRTRFGGSNPIVGAYFRFMPGLRPPSKGAETLVWLATSARAGIVSGGYYQDCRQIQAASRATDPAAAAALWAASLAATGLPAS